MNNEILVRVEGVSKKFSKDLKTSLKYGVYDITSQILGKKKRATLRESEFWAVNDVSFELRRGECLGLIGHNGAGKSTLLKMLNGLLMPDQGKIEMYGKIGALIELGAGFNPILTGRENIYNNASVLGFSKKEIDERYDEIVAFSEIGEFIEMPVQNYSSGMKVRLGFAIASQMRPDVLIIDEVLAVGDAGFKIKCYNEIYRIMEKSAVIFVSHSMPQVGKVCTRGILLKNGQVSFSSYNISEAMAAYYDSFKLEPLSKEGNGKAEIIEIIINNLNQTYTFSDFSGKSKNECGFVDFSGETDILINLKFEEEIKSFSVLISISDVDQKTVAQIIPPPEYIELEGKSCKVSLTISNLLLNTGNYTLSFHIFNKSTADWGETLIGLRSAISFTIKRGQFVGSAPILIKAEWLKEID
jgi:lipopolysaccharide transport system ATP-binding protein